MHQPNHHNAPLDARISAIESSLEKLRRDTGRLSTMSARNRQDLDHALADLDNLLYATLAAGRELPPAGPPNESQDGGVPAEAGPADAPRCTDPRHDDDPPESRPAASHLITLQPRSRSQEQPQADALPRCIGCANRTLASSAGQRITVTPIPDEKRAKGLNCAAPIHASGRQRTAHNRHRDRRSPAPASATATPAPPPHAPSCSATTFPTRPPSSSRHAERENHPHPGTTNKRPATEPQPPRRRDAGRAR